MEQRDSFVFYRSYYEAIQGFNKESQCKIYNAIIRYALYGDDPQKDVNPNTKLDANLMAIFILIKPNIDNANNRYNASVSNGKKGRSSIKKPKKT